MLLSIFIIFPYFFLFLYGWRPNFQKISKFSKFSLEYIHQWVDRIILMYFWGLKDTEFDNIVLNLNRFFCYLNHWNDCIVIYLCQVDLQIFVHINFRTISPLCHQCGYNTSIVFHHLLGQCLHWLAQSHQNMPSQLSFNAWLSQSTQSPSI